MSRPLVAHAAVAFVCSLLHDAYHVRRGAPLDILWLCNVAVPLVALGCGLRSRRAIAVGLTWLGFGTPIWLLGLLMGANMIPTSPLVHVVAPAVAFDAVRRVGWPAGKWPRAVGGSFVVLLVTRLIGDESGNVNLVFSIPPGLEHAFLGSHGAFLGALVAASLVWAMAFDRGMTRAFGDVARAGGEDVVATGR